MFSSNTRHILSQQYMNKYNNPDRYFIFIFHIPFLILLDPFLEQMELLQLFCNVANETRNSKTYTTIQ